MKDDQWLEEVSEKDGVYSEAERESLIDDDEISAEEEAFMRGWEDASKEEEALLSLMEEALET